MAWNISWALGSSGFLSWTTLEARLPNATHWVMLHGLFLVGLFDFNLCCVDADLQEVIVGSVVHHWKRSDMATGRGSKMEAHWWLNVMR